MLYVSFLWTELILDGFLIHEISLLGYAKVKQIAFSANFEQVSLVVFLTLGKFVLSLICLFTKLGQVTIVVFFKLGQVIHLVTW